MAKTFYVAFMAIAGFMLSTTVPAANAQSANDLGAFVGRWQLNPAKTHMGRMGPDGNNLVRAPTFTFVFAPAARGLLINIYAEYPQPAPTRTTALIPDEKQHRCENQAACLTLGGNPDEQSFSYYKVNSRFLVRLFYIKGQISEYSTYAVSADGKTFTLISWSPETPYYQNIQVFDRQ